MKLTQITTTKGETFFTEVPAYWFNEAIDWVKTYRPKSEKLVFKHIDPDSFEETTVSIDKISDIENICTVSDFRKTRQITQIRTRSGRDIYVKISFAHVSRIRSKKKAIHRFIEIPVDMLLKQCGDPQPIEVDISQIEFHGLAEIELYG